MSESRLKKSYLNARVNVFFYLVTLFISFFSRKIFLEKLGADFVGLTGTMQNLLGFLNLAELGIGASIGYVLYKPIFDGNRDKIKEIISVLGYLYRNVGLLILGAGLLLACFLPYIFAGAGIHFGVIYFAYFAFLASALIGYFVNYRQTLLGADQRNYVVTVYFQTANIVKILLQTALACHVGSFYLWIAIELIFGILYSFILNWKINRVYPWLKCEVAEGRRKYPENKIIVRKARQMFVHKLAGNGQDAAFAFSGVRVYLTEAGGVLRQLYAVAHQAEPVCRQFSGQYRSGRGQPDSRGSVKRIQQVFWELSSLRFLIASFLTFSLYHLTDPFITVWLGEEYVLPRSVLIIILTNFFISQFRGTNDQFIFGYGLFHDTWAAVATLAITVAVALAGGFLWGLPGVLLGDVASSLTVVSVWKPYLLYKEGFGMPVMSYWKNIFLYLLLAVLSWGLTDVVLCFLPLPEPSQGYGMWMVYALVSSLVFLLILCGGFYCCSAGMRSLVRRFRRR